MSISSASERCCSRRKRPRKRKLHTLSSHLIGVNYLRPPFLSVADGAQEFLRSLNASHEVTLPTRVRAGSDG